MRTIIAVIFIMTIVACSKKNEGPGEINKDKKLVSSTYWKYNASFSYNADGKIKEINYTFPNGPVMKKSITYGNSSAAYITYKDGKKYHEGNLQLNNGFISTYHFKSFNDDGSLKTEYTAEYFYNSNNRIEKIDYKNGFWSLYFYDVEGQLTRIENWTSQGKWSSTEYEYHNIPDKQTEFNPELFGFGMEQFSPPFATRLLKKYTNYSEPGHTADQEVSFTYQLDETGRVVQGTRSSPTPSQNWNWVNTWQ